MQQVQTGIWLDFKEAYVVSLHLDGQAAVKHFRSEVRHPATKGGTRSKSPWGPQFAPPDDTNLEREKHAERRYFQQILESINPDTEGVVIFGPAQAKLGLKKEIEQIKHYSPKFFGAFPADYLSKNEIVALMRDFFKNPDEYARRKKEEEPQ